MPKAKPYSGPVDEQVARQLINSTGHSVDINGDKLLLGDALLAAADQLKELVTEANSQLRDNDFAKIIAEHLANDLNKRGGAQISVTDSGQVQLYVNYAELPRSVRQKPKRKRKLPLMAELKARAEEMGVTIPEELGIKRSKIVEYLDGVENGDIKEQKKTKPKKKAPPVLVAEDPVETDHGPMSAGPDETKVSAPLDDPKPPKKPRGFVKTSEAISGPVVVSSEVVPESTPAPKKEAKVAKMASEGPPKGSPKTMRQIVESSKDIDISNLLASDTPD